MQDWKLEPAKDHGLPTGERLRSLRRECGLLETAGHIAWWSLVRAYLAVGHRLEVHGREHLPAEPPFILVANHASHLDALVLGSVLPWRLRDQVFPIAAADTFFESSVAAAFAVGLLNALPMWRRRASPTALRDLRERLTGEPCGYILFPESTRSRDGTMSQFKPGVGMFVAGTDVPIIPCHLDSTFRCLPPHRVWPRFHKITLHIGEPLRFPGVENARPGWEQIAREAEAAVRRLGRL
jgi:1-acyl-sn-glycerol-3-phosphate acyltransferase